MPEPTECDRARSAACYRSRCDLLIGLEGFHVIDVAHRGDRLEVVIESLARVEGCAVCGVVEHSHSRSRVRLVDAPCFAGPVQS